MQKNGKKRGRYSAILCGRTNQKEEERDREREEETRCFHSYLTVPFSRGDERLNSHESGCNPRRVLRDVYAHGSKKIHGEKKGEKLCIYIYIVQFYGISSVPSRCRHISVSLGKCVENESIFILDEERGREKERLQWFL